MNAAPVPSQYVPASGSIRLERAPEEEVVNQYMGHWAEYATDPALWLRGILQLTDCLRACREPEDN